MPPSGDGRTDLADRLLELRTTQWPGRTIKQAELAKALAVSAPSVSSWENNKVVPAADRLDAYATFFASERSVTSRPYQLLSIHDLTVEERERRDMLATELAALRERALRDAAREAVPPREVASPSSAGEGFWRFDDRGPIMLVCGRLPGEMVANMAYADKDSPDYAALYGYADPDSLLELYGYIRACNPDSAVEYRTSDQLTPDHLRNHLVLLGGTDWNEQTREFFGRRDIGIPVRQYARYDDDEVGGFRVDGVGDFRPELTERAGKRVLVSDVVHLVRASSPYTHGRTVTVCNGSYGRGVLGAVLAFTSAEVRDTNESYLAERFSNVSAFSILARVVVSGGKVVPLNLAESKLHEWPPISS